MRFVLMAAVAALALAAPAGAATVGLSGRIWKAERAFGSLIPGTQIRDARNLVATTPVAVTFTATALDYPNGDTGFQLANDSIADFLGRDAAGAVGNTAQNVAFTAFLFTGLIDLRPGQNEFFIQAFDGFALDVDGKRVGEFENSNPNGQNRYFFDAMGGGLKRFELLYFDNSGDISGLTAVLNGKVIDASMTRVDPAPVAPVPLPPAAAMMAAALGGLALLRRRRPRGGASTAR